MAMSSDFGQDVHPSWEEKAVLVRLKYIGERNSESENFVKEGPCSAQKILTRKTIPHRPQSTTAIVF
jgi:hypothetical protein